jgi:hypothetical protein
MTPQRIKFFLVKAVPVVLLAVLLLLVDITLNQADINIAGSDMLPQLPQATELDSSSAKAEGIVALYNKFDIPADDTVGLTEPEQQSNENQGLTLAEQESQEGLLRTLYINDEIYRLSAIINQGQYVASLSVTDIKAPDIPPTRRVLKAKDTLYHYDVVSVTSRRITLRHQQRELWLQLFTPEQTESVPN